MKEKGDEWKHGNTSSFGENSFALQSDITWLVLKQCHCIINVMKIFLDGSYFTFLFKVCNLVLYNFYIISSVHSIPGKNTNLLGFEFIVAFYKWTIFIVLSDSPTVQTHASFFYYRRFILLKSFDPTWTLMCIAISIISSMNSDMMCTVYPVSVLVFTRKHGSSWLKDNSNSGYKYNSNMLGKLLHFPLS